MYVDRRMNVTRMNIPEHTSREWVVNNGPRTKKRDTDYYYHCMGSVIKEEIALFA